MAAVPRGVTDALSFRQGSPEWKELRERAATDLFWFASVVLGYANHFPYEADTHLLPTRFLERRTGNADIDHARRMLVMWPRECGKSSIGTIAHAVQLACANPNIAILIANEKAETAQDFLATIKHQFESNEFLRALFPEVLPEDFNKTTWSASRATLRRETSRPEPTFDTIGVGGTVTGKHYDVIICDDLISREAMENARAGSWLIMDRVNRWVNQLEPLLSESAPGGPWMRFIGTNWWHSDTYDYIEKAFGKGERHEVLLKATLPTGERISRSVYRVGGLSVMRIAGIENGAPTFPKIWSLKRMAELRERDPELFAANIMNAPADAAVRAFQDSWLRYWRPIDRRLVAFTLDDGQKRMVFVDQLLKTMTLDPAFSSTGGSRSACVVLGTDLESGKHLVLEAMAARVEPRDLVEDVLEIAKRYNITRIYVELAGQQAAFHTYLDAVARSKNMPVIVEPVKPSGRAKDVRIEPLAAYFRNGQILVNGAQTDLLDEYTRYRPGARENDLLDALAYAVEKAPMAAPRRGYASAAERSAQQLSAYRARRGLAGATAPSTPLFSGEPF